MPVRPLASLLSAVAISATLIAPVAAATPTPAGATSPAPLSLPQTVAATDAGTWLAARVQPGGYVASASDPTQPDFSATANTVFGLAATGVDEAKAQLALSYLASHVNDDVTVGGSDGPGQLALLILDAVALGSDPRAFGGSDLVARLEATQQSSGSDVGLFGVQDPTYDGTYRQGLALAALAAAGVTSGTSVTSGESWLIGQQCPNGGWTTYESSANPCSGSPADYLGPDTNSTALAIEGLEAQHDLSSPAATSALAFLTGAQDKDGGWGYEPNAPHAPGFTDPDSTALVLQALLSMHVSPAARSIGKKGGGPVASLLSDELFSGSSLGGVVFPGGSGGDQLATEQAAPALAGVTIAYDLSPVAVTKIAPRKGPVSGGTIVTITGTSLYAATGVHFGATAATSFTALSDTRLVATAPAGAGTVDVTVTTPSATSAVSTSDLFTYKP